ncbi:unnamed protein product [Schistosoma curassoni]|uniref:Uncharacterized protein n=1 Tax=Schistosoma curassoni TaxID=6186 RepID=A0A183K797_9TREM|nr:unnamed protein product [Schistosoma curassoni]
MLLGSQGITLQKTTSTIFPLLENLEDTNKLNEFKITLINTLQTLQDLPKEEETNMKDNWKGIKEIPTPECQELLGRNKHNHKKWIYIETLDKIKERKNEKKAINSSRTRTEKVKAQAE